MENSPEECKNDGNDGSDNRWNFEDIADIANIAGEEEKIGEVREAGEARRRLVELIGENRRAQAIALAASAAILLAFATIKEHSFKKGITLVGSAVEIEQNGAGKEQENCEGEYANYVEEMRVWADNFLREKIGVEPGVVKTKSWDIPEDEDFCKRLFVKIHGTLSKDYPIEYNEGGVVKFRRENDLDGSRLIIREGYEAMYHPENGAVCSGNSARESFVYEAAGFDSCVLEYYYTLDNLSREEADEALGHAVCWVNLSGKENPSIIDGAVCDPTAESEFSTDFPFLMFCDDWEDFFETHGYGIDIFYMCMRDFSEDGKVLVKHYDAEKIEEEMKKEERIELNVNLYYVD